MEYRQWYTKRGTKFKRPCNIYKIILYARTLRQIPVVFVFFLPCSVQHGFDRSEHCCVHAYNSNSRPETKRISYYIIDCDRIPPPLNRCFERRSSTVHGSCVCVTRWRVPARERVHGGLTALPHECREDSGSSAVSRSKQCDEHTRGVSRVLIDFFYYHSPRPLRRAQCVIITRPETREARMSTDTAAALAINVFFFFF